ncbi:MAG: hypothetical protein ACXWW4_10365, partial [Candidatus Binatia bacterium]
MRSQAERDTGSGPLWIERIVKGQIPVSALLEGRPHAMETKRVQATVLAPPAMYQARPWMD